MQTGPSVIFSKKIDEMFGHGCFVKNRFKLRLFNQNSVLLLIYKAKLTKTSHTSSMQDRQTDRIEGSAED